MKQEERYLVAVDLDATFLNSDSQITEKSKKYVRKFIKNGSHFLINTGRPHQSAINFLRDMDVHEPMICSNGSAIVFYDEEYKKIEKAITFSIPLELTKEFFSQVKGFLKGGIVNTLYNVISYDFNNVPFWVVHTSELVSKQEGDIESLLKDEVLSIEVYVKNEFINEFNQIFFKKEYQDAFFYIDWGCYDGVHSIEIHASNASKGKALKYMAKYYDIKDTNTFGFGDQLNDLPLLEDAYYGVSMINAREEVKNLTKYQTKKDNNHDGVIDFVESTIKSLK